MCCRISTDFQNMLEKILKELNFSDNTIKVYKRLLELGDASARQLAENIGIPRPSVYDYLNILIENGLIIQQSVDNKTIFRANEVSQLKHLIKEKIEVLEIESKNIEKYVPANQEKNIEPKIRHFKGIEQVKKILNDLSWYENTEILSIWPMKEMLMVLGSDYLENFNRKRIKNNNPLKIVWPKDKIVNIDEFPFLGISAGHKRDLRIAPMDMTWNMGHTIYEDKVAFISSHKETFGFIVQSKDFAELMKAQFEVVWNISKPLNYTPPEKDAFLDTL
jgi:sugar-specific transcriptional regulator TrmB